MSDVLTFIRSWVVAPKRVSAILPSSAALAELITSEIDPDSAPVLELGPGTGVFTRALLERGLDQRDLTLVETGSHFARLLARRYPDVRVLEMDATRLGRESLYGPGELATAISGLPLLSMSSRQIMGILSGVFGYLRDDGAFYQFTYGPRCPVPRSILIRHGLCATRIGAVVRNVPPSSVYRIQKRIVGDLRISA